MTGNTYVVDKPGTSIRFEIFTILPDFEITITDSRHHKAVLFEQQPDEDTNLIHFNLINEGRYTQSYSDQQQYVEAGTSKGAFIYNGLFDISNYYPPNLAVKSIGFKVTRKTLNQVMPEASNIVDSLFSSDEPMAYHTSLLPELETLIIDIFQFRDIEFGKTPLLIARSLELFTLFLKKIRQLLDNDDIHGLYADDYNRLLEIRSKLLSNFHQ